MPGGMLPPVLVELKAITGEFKTKIGEAKDELEKLDKKGSNHLSKLAGAGKLAAIGLAAAFVPVAVLSVKAATEYQSSMATVQGAAGLTDKQVRSLGDTFLSTMGHSTFSAQEMATAFGPVAGVVKTLSGGTLTAGQSMQFMRAAMDASEATGGSLSATTGTLAQVMQAFGLRTGEAGETANQLFNISRTTGVGLTDLGSVVSRLHGRLGEVSPTLQDTGALMVDLAQHGISGSRGVMVVQTALTTLLGGSKKTSVELKALGVHVFDASGKFVGMRAVLTQLAPHLKNLTDQQRQAAETALFGTSAASALNSTVLAGVGAFNRAASAVGRKGAVDKAAEVQAHTLHGQMHMVAATAEDMAVKFGQLLIPVIQRTIAVIGDIVGWLVKHKTVAEILAGVIGGALVTAIGAWVVSLMTATVTIGETTLALGPIGLAIGAVIAIAVLLATHWKQVWGWIKEALSAAWNDVIKPVFGFIKEHWGIVFAVVTGGLSLLLQHWRQVWDGIKTVLRAVWDDVIKPVFGWIKTVAIAGVVDGVHGLQTAWRDSLGAVKTVLQGAWNDVIKPVFNLIKTVAIDPIMTAVHGLGSAWSAVWGAIKTVLQDAWGVLKPILDTIKRAINDTIGLIGKAIGAVGKVAGAIGHGVGKAAGFVASLFADGGWTPGAVGMPSPAILHGGEYVLSNSMLHGGQRIDPTVAAAVVANVAHGGAQGMRGTGSAVATAAQAVPAMAAGRGTVTLAPTYSFVVHGDVSAETQDRLRALMAEQNADLVRHLTAAGGV